MELFNAKEIYREQRKENGTMTMTGKISRKKVDNYAWGDKITFLVNGKWISALVKKGSPPPAETMELLRSLQEGDEAQFEVVESPNKTDPSKPPYLNVTGIVRVDRMDAEVAPASQPDGNAGKHYNDAPDSMILSYAKDGAIAICQGEKVGTEVFLSVVKGIYLGMKSILAGE
jgi:hypothetical protein